MQQNEQMLCRKTFLMIEIHVCRLHSFQDINENLYLLIIYGKEVLLNVMK